MGENEKDDKRQLLFEVEMDGFILRGHLTADRMSLYLEGERVDGGDKTVKIQLSTLLESISEHVSPQLLNERTLDDTVSRLNAEGKCVSRRIAQGQAPSNGQDGKVVLLVKKYTPPQKDKDREHQSSSNIRFFDNIEAGQDVARIYPPKAGTSGLTALNEVIDAESGNPCIVTFDQSVSQRDDGHSYQTLSANSAGYLAFEKDHLTIEDVLKLSDDISVDTGSIDFVGSVEVKGSVVSPSYLHARGNITVSGDVYHASVVSDQGSIEIKGSIIGAFEATEGEEQKDLPLQSPILAQIRAKQDVKAFIVAGASIEAHGMIEIVKECRFSYLRSGSIVSMPTGHIFGGQASVVCGLEASIIGSQSGRPTRIHLCSDIEASAEFIEIKQKLRDLEHAEELMLHFLGPYANSADSISRLSDKAQREKLEKMKKKLGYVVDSKEKLNQQIVSLLQASHHSTIMRVSFHKKLHPGVEVLAESEIFLTEELASGPKTIEFDADERTFIEKELTALACSLELFATVDTNQDPS